MGRRQLEVLLHWKINRFLISLEFFNFYKVFEFKLAIFLIEGLIGIIRLLFVCYLWETEKFSLDYGG